MSDLRAVAYESGGRWVVDCPNGCGNAWTVQPSEQARQCYSAPQPNGLGGYTKAIGCMSVFAIDWPKNPEDIFAAKRAEQRYAKQAERAYIAAAKREHEAQHTDDEGEPGDGQDKANARGAARLKKAGKSDAQ